MLSPPATFRVHGQLYTLCIYPPPDPNQDSDLACGALFMRFLGTPDLQKQVAFFGVRC